MTAFRIVCCSLILINSLTISEADDSSLERLAESQPFEFFRSEDSMEVIPYPVLVKAKLRNTNAVNSYKPEKGTRTPTDGGSGSKDLDTPTTAPVSTTETQKGTMFTSDSSVHSKFSESFWKRFQERRRRRGESKNNVQNIEEPHASKMAVDSTVQHVQMTPVQQLPRVDNNLPSSFQKSYFDTMKKLNMPPLFDDLHKLEENMSQQQYNNDGYPSANNDKKDAYEPHQQFYRNSNVRSPIQESNYRAYSSVTDDLESSNRYVEQEVPLTYEVTEWLNKNVRYPIPYNPRNNPSHLTSSTSVSSPSTNHISHPPQYATSSKTHAQQSYQNRAAGNQYSSPKVSKPQQNYHVPTIKSHYQKIQEPTKSVPQKSNSYKTAQQNPKPYKTVTQKPKPYMNTSQKSRPNPSQRYKTKGRPPYSNLKRPKSQKDMPSKRPMRPRGKYTKPSVSTKQPPSYRPPKKAPQKRPSRPVKVRRPMMYKPTSKKPESKPPVYKAEPFAVILPNYANRGQSGQTLYEVKNNKVTGVKKSDKVQIISVNNLHPLYSLPKYMNYVLPVLAATGLSLLVPNVVTVTTGKRKRRDVKGKFSLC